MCHSFSQYSRHAHGSLWLQVLDYNSYCHAINSFLLDDYLLTFYIDQQFYYSIMRLLYQRSESIWGNWVKFIFDFYLLFFSYLPSNLLPSLLVLPRENDLQFDIHNNPLIYTVTQGHIVQKHTHNHSHFIKMIKSIKAYVEQNLWKIICNLSIVEQVIWYETLI